jgi:hypothetical protein
MMRTTGWIVIGTLFAAAAYELALALGAGTLGPEPGDGVTGSDAVRLVALLAMVVACVLAIGFSVLPSRTAALLAPAAAAFLVAFYFTYDPYFAPQLRRYSEGNVAGRWIVIVGVLTLAAAILTRLRPRLGAAVTSGAILVVLATTVLAGAGH